MALEIATIATQADLQQVAMEAVKRILESGPPVQTPTFQSNLLMGSNGGVNAPQIVNSPFGVSGFGMQVVRDARNGTQPPVDKLLILVNEWRERKFDPKAVAETLSAIVMPAGRPNEVFLYSEQEFARRLPIQLGNFNSIFQRPKTQRSLGIELMRWAKESGQLEIVAAELESRSKNMMGDGSGVALLIFGHRLADQPDRVALVAKSVVDKGAMPRKAGLIVQALLCPLEKSKEEELRADPLTEQVLGLALKSADFMEVLPWYATILKSSIVANDREKFNQLLQMVTDAIEVTPLQQPNQSTPQLRLEMRKLLFAQIVTECQRNNRPILETDCRSR